MRTMTTWIGWAASFVLLLTICTQVHKQWADRTSRGVSKWLYIGQIASEVGFIIYSWSLGSWVFVVTNVLLLLSNLVGLGIVFHHRRRAALGDKLAA